MVKIKIFVPSGQAKSGPPLAPVLGQHQINLVEFCKIFNLKSNELYSLGIPVRVKIYKQKTNITYSYKPITFSSLMRNFVFYINKERVLYFSQCYDILLIRLSEENNANEKTVAKQLFGFLKSVKISLKNG